jgi:hypothetical protein
MARPRSPYRMQAQDGDTVAGHRARHAAPHDDYAAKLFSMRGRAKWGEIS